MSLEPNSAKTPPAPGAGMLAGLQALRFVASASIVIHHLLYYGREFWVIPRETMETAPVFFAVGVPVFFTLSGFLMAKVSERTSPVRFAAHRVLRIYPAFLGAVALTVLAQRLSGTLRTFDPLALSLLPVGVINYPLGVEWSLVYEVFFYFVIAALSALPTDAMRKRCVAIWLVAICYVNVTASAAFTVVLPTIWQVPLSCYNLMFISGMAAWWLRHYAERWQLPLLLFGVSTLTVAEVAHLSVPQQVVMLSLGSAMLVSAVAAPRTSAIFGKFAIVLGEGSYGIYLLHVPVITITFSVFPGKGMAVAAATFICAIGSGLAYGLAESRLYRMTSRIADKFLVRTTAFVRDTQNS